VRHGKQSKDNRYLDAAIGKLLALLDDKYDGAISGA